MAYQTGSIYKHNGSWCLKYRITELKDGTPSRVHKTVMLCAVNGEQHHPLCEKHTEHRTKKSVEPVRDKIMQDINAQSTAPQHDMSISDFWEQKYLPYCESEYKGKGMKPSTVRGFKQIWNQHLKTHFAKLTLHRYQPDNARKFLASLKTTQGKNTLKHIRGLAGAMFSEAIERGYRKESNPWHVKLPKDCKETGSTQHYTLEEAENIISALIDHVDAQLVMALSCFLALRPGEIAALKWEDFDRDNVHIRRSVVRGNVDVPKTPESVASLPLIDAAKIPLLLWHKECGKPKEGYVFESRNGTPVDLHNLIARVIRPHVEGLKECERCHKVPKKSSAKWKTLYAGRRGACTIVIEATGGNYAVGQALLRHKSMMTTLNVYKKAITPEAFRAGMKMLQAGITANGRSN